MRTTIDIPDELFRRAKARAALDGISLKELMTRYVREGLTRNADGAEGEARPRSALPIARPATGRPLTVQTGADLHRILDDEEAGGGGGD